MSNTTDRLAWTVDEAAFRAGLSRKSMYRLISVGKITPTKVGRRTLIPEAELQRLMSEGYDGPLS